MLLPRSARRSVDRGRALAAAARHWRPSRASMRLDSVGFGFGRPGSLWLLSCLGAVLPAGSGASLSGRSAGVVWFRSWFFAEVFMPKHRVRRSPKVKRKRSAFKRGKVPAGRFARGGARS